jgi:hypothetical protein
MVTFEEGYFFSRIERTLYDSFGKSVWTIPIVPSHVHLERGVFYYRSHTGMLISKEVATGKTLWTTKLSSSSFRLGYEKGPLNFRKGSSMID